MRKLFMPEHFADMKQAYIASLLKALKNYDIKQGTPFTSFKERYVEREILDYVRSMHTSFTAQSIAKYAKLRKAMAIWDKYKRDYSDETLIKVASELEETVENTKEILLGGLLNKNRVDLYRQYTDDDGEESTEETHSDSSPDTYTLFMKKELYARLWESYEKLEYTERKMLSQRLGFCFECYSVFYMDYGNLDEYGELKKKPVKPICIRISLPTTNTAQ